MAELPRLLTGLLHGSPNDVGRTEGIPSVVPGDDLAALVLAQKIASKTEGRSVDLRDVVPSPRIRDVELGYVSRERALQDYGIAFADDGNVDDTLTTRAGG